MSAAAMYKSVERYNNPKELSKQVIRSVELYLEDLTNESADWAFRCEAGINAQTILISVSQNIQEEISEDEQQILIKIFGQIIKSINKYIRKEIDNLDKEFAGMRLIKKLIN